MPDVRIILRASDPLPQVPSDPIGQIRTNELTEAQRALLGIIHDLQLRSGWCYASHRYLATALAVPMDRDDAFSDRHVRKLCSQLRGKDCVAIINRKGKPTLMRVLKLPVSEAVMQRPRNSSSYPPRNCSSAPDRNRRSAYRNTPDRKISRPSAGNSSEEGLFTEKRYFNPLRAHHRRQENGDVDYDNRPPQQRVCDARRAGEFLFCEWNKVARLVAAARWSHHLLYLDLTDEEKGVNETMTIPAREVGSLRLWR